MALRAIVNQAVNRLTIRRWLDSASHIRRLKDNVRMHGIPRKSCHVFSLLAAAHRLPSDPHPLRYILYSIVYIIMVLDLSHSLSFWVCAGLQSASKQKLFPLFYLRLHLFLSKRRWFLKRKRSTSRC